MRNDIEERIKQIDIENKIWIIYIGIIVLSWYSNYYEKRYFLSNDLESKEKYRKTTIFIFSILLVIYFYFLKSSIEDIKKLNPSDTNKKKNLVYLSFLGSLFIFLSGLIFLYIAITDENINIEVAFN